MSQYLETHFPDLSDIYALLHSNKFMLILLVIPDIKQKSAFENVNPTLRYEFSNLVAFRQFCKKSEKTAKATKFEN